MNQTPLAWLIITLAAATLTSVTYYTTTAPKTNDASPPPPSPPHRTLSLDPKTVIQKPPPMTPHRRPPGQIRYAAFGASTTWGSGLPDRSTQAYPFLLSPSAKNYAIRAAGPNYPAACAYSLVGDDTVLDVIILEFFAQSKFGLVPLARRLRERFPEAIIVILREWYPRLVTTSDGVGLREWADAKGFGRFAVHDPEMHRAFLASEEEWHWELINQSAVIDLQVRAAEEVGGYILEMPRPKEEDIASWINYADLFAEDYMHKSVKGHWEVHFRVRELVDRIGVPAEPRLGQWGFRDSCHMWFESGNPGGLQYSKTIELKEISNRNGAKYALEWSPGRRPGIIHVWNPAGEPMTLYLVYMTTGPPPSNYAPTEVEFVDDVRKERVILDPNARSEYDHYFFVHIQNVAEVGEIPPGETRLRLVQLEDSKWPFRLIGVVVTKKGEGSAEFSRVTATKLESRGGGKNARNKNLTDKK